MVIDRETIISLHKKKVRVIRSAQKSFKFGVKWFGKWSRSSVGQARHPIDRPRAEREQFKPSEWLRIRGKS